VVKLKSAIFSTQRFVGNMGRREIEDIKFDYRVKGLIQNPFPKASAKEVVVQAYSLRS
jgi:hypothetical protein